VVEPAVSAADDVVVTAIAAMSGATTFDASASASDFVSVDAEPNPPRTPKLLVEFPGERSNRLVPVR